MEQILTIKIWILSIIGVVGSCIASLFGGWDNSMGTLIIVMAIDYSTGFAVAAVFKKSLKTSSGALSSHVGWKGLCKKGVILGVVLIAARLDMMLGTKYIRNTVIIGYIANEVVSILENAKLMGIKIPDVLNKAIEVVQKKEKEEGNNE